MINHMDHLNRLGLFVLRQQLVIEDEFDKMHSMSVWDGSMRQLF